MIELGSAFACTFLPAVPTLKSFDVEMCHLAVTFFKGICPQWIVSIEVIGSCMCSEVGNDSAAVKLCVMSTISTAFQNYFVAKVQGKGCNMTML